MQTRTNDEGFISQKGMGYKTITDQALADKVKWLDHRPWKSLDDQTPYEVYRQAWNGALASRIDPFMVAGGIHAQFCKAGQGTAGGWIATGSSSSPAA